MKTERVRWEVLPAGGLLRRWKVTRKGVVVGTYLFQYLAVAAAVAGCNLEWDRWKQPSELLIKGRDGQIKDPRTYGHDPRGTKG